MASCPHLASSEGLDGVGGGPVPGQLDKWIHAIPHDGELVVTDVLYGQDGAVLVVLVEGRNDLISVQSDLGSLKHDRIRLELNLGRS